MHKTIAGSMMLLVLAMGIMIGFTVQKLPLPVAVMCCGLWAFVSMFIGMTLFALISRGKEDVSVNETIFNMRENVSRLLEQQRSAYHELLKASSRIVASRVAERTVIEMMHGLDNGEQRDAAFKQMNSIVDEELNALGKVLSTKTSFDDRA